MAPMKVTTSSQLIIPQRDHTHTMKTMNKRDLQQSLFFFLKREAMVLYPLVRDNTITLLTLQSITQIHQEIEILITTYYTEHVMLI